MTDDDVIEMVRQIPNHLPPASPQEVVDAEHRIGYRLPRVLRRLFLEAANGGFGPRRGVMGVAGREFKHLPGWADLADFTVTLRDDPWMLWLFDWGCAIYSLVDCRDPEGPMWVCDENQFYPQNMTISEWLVDSIAGRLALAFETSSWGLSDVAQRRSRADNEYHVPDPELFTSLPESEIVSTIRALPYLERPVSPDLMRMAEEEIGFPLPRFLRRVLKESNGEFGPGRKIRGLPTKLNHMGKLRGYHDIVLHHRLFSTGADRLVPDSLLWLCDMGSAIWVLVDRDERMWCWDPMGPYPRPVGRWWEDPDGPGAALFPLNMSLTEWLSAWVKGCFDGDFHPATFRTIARYRS